MNLFSSESVTPGHPDKTCDLISDAVLDALLRDDPEAHSAVEVFATSKGLHIGGEVSGDVDAEGIARRVLRNVGWDGVNGLDPETFPVSVELRRQSVEIRNAVQVPSDASADRLDCVGAGDQGLMFGFACDETPELMPLPIMVAHALARRLAAVRRRVPWLSPDGKTQVTFELDEVGVPTRLHTVVVSAQHAPGVRLCVLREMVLAEVISPVLDRFGLPLSGVEVLVNPAGVWTLGGPLADTGLTGRKIIVDTYGGSARHGGGAFSGKDATKVDRSGAYAARLAAKSVVAAGLAKRCEVQVAYAIGRAHPVGLSVETFGTGVRPDTEIAGLLEDRIDFRPAAIIENLGLHRPIFEQTACFGHFGDGSFPWEVPVVGFSETVPRGAVAAGV